MHVVVDYHEADNLELAERYDIHWGRNTIFLKQGKRTGQCSWRRLHAARDETVRWEAFDLGDSQDRPLARYLRSRRHAQFRKIILELDSYCCVLTGEATLEALEAAHLIPAKNGQNDIPFNGVTLRADLHRLFDAGMFTFGETGRVKFDASKPPSFDVYHQLLRNKRLPPATLARVRATLALPQFRERLCANPGATANQRGTG